MSNLNPIHGQLRDLHLLLKYSCLKLRNQFLNTLDRNVGCNFLTIVIDCNVMAAVRIRTIGNPR